MKPKVETVRKHLGLTQEQMAARLGMSTRAVQDIEAGKSQEREIHQLAADRISLSRAVTQNDPTLATPEMRDLALRLAFMILGTPSENVPGEGTEAEPKKAQPDLWHDRLNSRGEIVSKPGKSRII